MAIQRMCFFVLALLHGVSGHGFLAAKPRMKLTAIHDEVLVAISDVLGGGHGINAERMAHIRATFTPLFQSLPKTQQGRLSAAVMGYAVQRYFSEQHGWMMKGFEPHNAAINASDLTNGGDVLQKKVPDFVRSVLEQKLAHGGFALEDAVAMIATLQRLILDEVIAAIELAFYLNEVETTQVLDAESFNEILVSYFINELISREDSMSSETNITQHRADKRLIVKRYPHWRESFRFLTDIAFNDHFEYRHAQNPFSERTFVFEDAVRISQRLSEEFGPFSNHECDAMKAALSSMDSQETGRVKMSDFYKGGAWQFTEGFEYLRQTGALDDSSKLLGAQVIIPNYIAGQNNCITSKQYYNICCLNECDLVYKDLEAAIPAPYASVAEIVAVIEGLPQMPDGKNLSKSLRDRLDDISSHHDGKVPMHGRLLAQWLHFVFPRDCPYPHMVGTIKPMCPGDYDKAGGSSDTTNEEIEQFLKAESARIAPSPDAGRLMWDFQEVLLDTATPMDRADGSGTARSFLRLCALAGLLGCLAAFALKESHRILAILRPEVKAVQYIV